MKKFFLLILSLTLFFSINSIQAQTHFGVGARAGLNLANTSYSPDVNSVVPGASQSGRTLFLVGGIFQLAFAGPLALEVEPTYIQKGTVLEGSNITFLNAQNVEEVFTNLKLTYKFSYIELPILLRVYIPVQGINLKPYAEAGPTVGFNLSSSYTADYTIQFQGSGSTNQDNSSNTSSVEFGLAFGAGLEYGVAPSTSIGLDIRYSLGLSDILTNQTAQPGQQTISEKTNGFQFTVFSMFAL